MLGGEGADGDRTGMNRAVIGLGSNIEPQVNVPKARKRIAERHVILAESPLVETSPVGYADQPDFTNGALLLETRADRETFQSHILRLTEQQGVLSARLDGLRDPPASNR